MVLCLGRTFFSVFLIPSTNLLASNPPHTAHKTSQSVHMAPGPQDSPDSQGEFDFLGASGRTNEISSPTTSYLPLPSGSSPAPRGQAQPRLMPQLSSNMVGVRQAPLTPAALPRLGAAATQGQQLAVAVHDVATANELSMDEDKEELMAFAKVCGLDSKYTQTS